MIQNCWTSKVQMQNVCKVRLKNYLTSKVHHLRNIGTWYWLYFKAFSWKDNLLSFSSFQRSTRKIVEDMSGIEHLIHQVGISPISYLVTPKKLHRLLFFVYCWNDLAFRYSRYINVLLKWNPGRAGLRRTSTSGKSGSELKLKTVWQPRNYFMQRVS